MGVVLRHSQAVNRVELHVAVFEQYLKDADSVRGAYLGVYRTMVVVAQLADRDEVGQIQEGIRLRLLTEGSICNTKRTY